MQSNTELNRAQQLFCRVFNVGSRLQCLKDILHKSDYDDFKKT